eukprot:1160935-Pelagomonas_calceolata.AAC.1
MAEMLLHPSHTSKLSFRMIDHHCPSRVMSIAWITNTSRVSEKDPARFAALQANAGPNTNGSQVSGKAFHVQEPPLYRLSETGMSVQA